MIKESDEKVKIWFNKPIHSETLIKIARKQPIPDEQAYNRSARELERKGFLKTTYKDFSRGKHEKKRGVNIEGIVRYIDENYLHRGKVNKFSEKILPTNAKYRKGVIEIQLADYLKNTDIYITNGLHTLFEGFIKYVIRIHARLLTYIKFQRKDFLKQKQEKMIKVIQDEQGMCPYDYEFTLRCAFYGVNYFPELFYQLLY